MATLPVQITEPDFTEFVNFPTSTTLSKHFGSEICSLLTTGIFAILSYSTRSPMQRILLFFALFIFALSACKNDPTPKEKFHPGAESVAQASPAGLAGFWINSGFVTRARIEGSILKPINSDHLPYAYMLFFDAKSPGKVAISNGAEAKVLDVVYNRDTIEMKNAVDNKSIFLVYDSETGGKTITMFDGTGSGRTQMDEFVKSSSDETDGNLIFANALNYNLFGKKLYNGKQQVIFDPKGLLSGLDEWTGYQVCLRGSCFKMGPQMDIVNLSNKNKGVQELFGWEYSTNQDTLTLFKLRPSANPDSVYTVIGKAYTLLSKGNVR